MTISVVSALGRETREAMAAESVTTMTLAEHKCSQSIRGEAYALGE